MALGNNRGWFGTLLMIKSPLTIVLKLFHEIADPRHLVWIFGFCCCVKLSGSVDLALKKCAFSRILVVGLCSQRWSVILTSWQDFMLGRYV